MPFSPKNPKVLYLLDKMKVISSLAWGWAASGVERKSCLTVHNTTL